MGTNLLVLLALIAVGIWLNDRSDQVKLPVMAIVWWTFTLGVLVWQFLRP